MIVAVVHSMLAGCAPVELTTSSEPTSPTETTAIDCAGACVVATGGASRVSYHRVAVDGDGVAWLSWLDIIDGAVVNLYVARSPVSGAPLAAPLLVPTAEPAIVSTSEKPDLDVSADRIALAYTGRGALRHADAHAAYVQTGTIGADGAVAFDEALQIDATEGPDWVLEQAHVALVADEAWVLYKRQIYGEVDHPTIAREGLGYAHDDVSAELSDRHECSPPDLIAATAGAPVAFATIRSNLEGALHTMVLAADGAGFGGPVQVSYGSWDYNPLICPNDGPVLAQQADGGLLAAWTAPEVGVAYRMYVARSTDGGATWSEPIIDHPDEDGDDLNPAVTPLADGRILTTAQIKGVTRAFVRGSLAEAPVASTLYTPLGSSLTDVEVASGGGRTVAAGFDDELRLWLVEIDPD